MAEPEPALSGAGALHNAKGAVLILHGGQVDSLAPAVSRQVAVAWMLPLARALVRKGADQGLAVWRLRFRYRGWNGDDAHPVQDVRWAMKQLRERHGDIPVVLLGHSMGGRAAVRAADERGVAGVLGLAPWLPSGEMHQQMAGRRLLVVHGLRDRITSPHESLAYVAQVRALGEPAAFVALRRCGHALVRRRLVWDRLTAGFVSEVALGIAGATPVEPGSDAVW